LATPDHVFERNVSIVSLVCPGSGLGNDEEREDTSLKRAVQQEMLASAEFLPSWHESDGTNDTVAAIELKVRGRHN